MTADSFASDRPEPSLPDLVGLGLIVLGKIATDHAELLATVKRIEASMSKPARKATAASVEALSERILSSLANPYTANDVRSWTTWGALRRDFGLTPHQRRALSEFWRKNGIVETRSGKGIRIVR